MCSETILKYIVITPVHNEEAFIEKAIQSMISQTIRPVQWVIVNDCSNDRSPDIIKQYESNYNFISFVNIERPPGRHFGNKARAFNRGLKEIKSIDYQYIGNLDADISMEQKYYETILNEFEKDGRLGLAGGIISSLSGNQFINQNIAPDSVAGAVQLFRRSCFEQIGGYLPLPLGGIDAAAEITARMNGWRVRTFPEVKVFEHRKTGTVKRSPLSARLIEGKRLYSLGYGFIFFCFRCIKRLKEPPLIIGSIFAIIGYIVSLAKGNPRVLPMDTIRFLKAEQRMKLRRRWSNLILPIFQRLKMSSDSSSGG